MHTYEASDSPAGASRVYKNFAYMFSHEHPWQARLLCLEGGIT